MGSPGHSVNDHKSLKFIPDLSAVLQKLVGKFHQFHLSLFCFISNNPIFEGHQRMKLVRTVLEKEKLLVNKPLLFEKGIITLP